MQLDGNIGQFHLSELIEMMVSSMITGVLKVGERGQIGQLYCGDGRIYHATAGDQEGVAALRRLLVAHGAPFHFVGGVRCGARTLWSDPRVVIGFAVQQEALLARMRPHIPSLDWVPMLRVSDDERIRISSEAWPVLASVDGQRSVGAIAATLVYEPLEVGVALSELLQRGLISIRPPAAALPEAHDAPLALLSDRSAQRPPRKHARKARPLRRARGARTPGNTSKGVHIRASIATFFAQLAPFADS